MENGSEGIRGLPRGTQLISGRRWIPVQISVLWEASKYASTPAIHAKHKCVTSTFLHSVVSFSILSLFIYHVSLQFYYQKIPNLEKKKQKKATNP